MNMSEEKTYEMMWDCEYCNTPKLLGKTHRFCPNCGAPQNPEKRYFPPENEKVAVEDHQFVGADLHCPACSFANSRTANNCGNCGSPLAGGKDAAMQQDQVLGPGGAPAAPPPAKTGKSKAGWIIGLIVFVILGVVAFFIVRACWTKEALLEVTAHSWKREIAVERYDEVKRSTPCKSMPSNAKRVTRTKAKPVCKTRKVDQGDGTFKQKKECTKPEEQCEYYVKAWKKIRTAKATGKGLDSKPHWPKVRLRRQGRCDGCEREGKRTETYTVHLKDKGSKEKDTCNYSDESKWRAFKKGKTYKGQVGGMGGDVDCGSLKP